MQSTSSSRAIFVDCVSGRMCQNNTYLVPARKKDLTPMWLQTKSAFVSPSGPRSD